MTHSKFEEAEFQKEKARLERLKRRREQEKELFKLRHPILGNIKKPSTSKIFVILAIAIMLEIIIFTELFMYDTKDSSGLYALIGIAATISATLFGYFLKSKAENTSGGIQYELAMSQLNSVESESEEIVNEDGSVG